MCHECPDCYQVCYCDCDDTFMECGSESCRHDCPDEPYDDDFSDRDEEDAEIDAREAADIAEDRHLRSLDE